jgi:hypothetical protein
MREDVGLELEEGTDIWFIRARGDSGFHIVGHFGVGGEVAYHFFRLIYPNNY